MVRCRFLWLQIETRQTLWYNNLSVGTLCPRLSPFKCSFFLFYTLVSINNSHKQCFYQYQRGKYGSFFSPYYDWQCAGKHLFNQRISCQQIWLHLYPVQKASKDKSIFRSNGTPIWRKKISVLSFLSRQATFYLETQRITIIWTATSF